MKPSPAQFRHNAGTKGSIAAAVTHSRLTLMTRQVGTLIHSPSANKPGRVSVLDIKDKQGTVHARSKQHSVIMGEYELSNAHPAAAKLLELPIQRVLVSTNAPSLCSSEQNPPACSRLAQIQIPIQQASRQTDQQAEHAASSRQSMHVRLPAGSCGTEQAQQAQQAGHVQQAKQVISMSGQQQAKHAQQTCQSESQQCEHAQQA